MGLFFNLGSLEFENDKAQQKAAWSLYVELSTRIAVQPLEDGEGISREALTSLYNVFGITRQILREADLKLQKSSNPLALLPLMCLTKKLYVFGEVASFVESRNLSIKPPLNMKNHGNAATNSARS